MCAFRWSFAVLVIMAPLLPEDATAFSARAPPPTTKKIKAQNFASFQLTKLQEAGLLGVKRPYTIVAEAIGTSAEKSMRGAADDDQNCAVTHYTKLIHFQRHGQGYHNLIGEMYREMLGRAIDLDDPNPATNPFVRPELLDSPLTEKGRLECAERRSQAALLNPQLIVVSPLQRALQTATLSFASHCNKGDEDDCGMVPQKQWMAHEGVREQMGLLLCNKRRSVSDLQPEFPHVDFSAMPHNADDLSWDPNQRESPREETERIYNFLTDFVMTRPEQEIAIVGHSAWLFTMCNAVVDCGDDDLLRSLFQTSEIRSMRLSFYKSKDV